MTAGDLILRAFSRLTALRENIPDDTKVPEKWARDFHDIITSLEQAATLGLNEFYVPNSEFGRRASGGNYLTGETYYMDGLWVERARLLQQIDSLLHYFTGLSSEQEKRIGFHVDR